MCGIATAQRVGELAANIAKISHIAISFVIINLNKQTKWQYQYQTSFR